MWKEVDKFIFSIPDSFLYLLLILGALFIINGLLMMDGNKSEQKGTMYALVILS